MTAPSGSTEATSSRPVLRSGYAVGREPVEGAVGLVLGQVDDLVDVVDGRRLVVEGPHGRQGHAAVRRGRVALPDLAAVELLTRQPGAPRRRAAGAVLGRAPEHPVGVDDVAVGVVLDGAGTALAQQRGSRCSRRGTSRRRPREGRRAVREPGPLELGALDHLAGPGDDP